MNHEMAYQKIKETHQMFNESAKAGNLLDMLGYGERLRGYLGMGLVIPETSFKSVYISHNLAARKALKESIIPLLYDNGFAVYSSWIWTEEGDSLNSCLACRNDLAESDYLLMFANQYDNPDSMKFPVPGRGKYVELGLAIEMGKNIVVVGGKEDHNCLFYWHPLVTYVNSSFGLYGIVDYLDTLRRGRYGETVRS